ncbi:hypothetical protein [Aurantiacibacter hainanensis]|uniref:hypothetical protein n=1 Tax=Aurantiacibacter hainanensis TaxID=3076114 RepID=UPI0030C739AB
MRPRLIVCSLAAAFPALPAAACDAKLEMLDPAIDIRPSPSFSEASSREQIRIRVANEGTTTCVLELELALDPAFAGPFPTYSIVGPGGVIEFSAQTGSGVSAPAPLRMPITLNAGVETTLEYAVAANVTWEMQAGSYDRRIDVALFDAADGSRLDDAQVELGVTVPLSSRIDFVGNVDRIDLGQLEFDRENVSPPFGIRVYSTSTYNMEMDSENAGNLRQEGGDALLPYAMSVSGQEINLASGSQVIAGLGKSAETGDVYGVLVRVRPEHTTPAGRYSDRLTVTVTTY